MIKFVTTLILLAAALATPAAFGAEDSGELAILKAELAATKARLAESEAKVRKLEASNANLQANIGAIQKATAFNGASESRKGKSNIGASSTLSWNQALNVGAAARYLVPGASLLSVLPTGSMKPLFDERALLMLEPAKYDDLKVGDIVTYKHSTLGMTVVHRIVEKRGDKFWAKGDNNARLDEEYITRENYQARVFGIVYANQAANLN